MVQVQSHFKQIPPSTCGFDVCPSSCEPIRCQRSACVAQDGADAQMTRQKLSEEGLIAEDWGGDVPMVEVSAKKNINLDDAWLGSTSLGVGLWEGFLEVS